ncbi:MAG: glycosyltransferase, partial [Chloroflexi bacterium]|nr:glycosyltransferase [Chloroflexota bacterium]
MSQSIKPSRRVSVKSPDRLRIAFIADCLEGSGGGLVSGRRFVTRLRQEHEVTLVSADPPSPGQVALPGFGTSIRPMRENGFVFARPQRDKLARVFAASDIVHLQFPFWLSMVALEEARKQHLPIVTAFHVQPENVLMNVGVRSQRLS